MCGELLSAEKATSPKENRDLGDFGPLMELDNIGSIARFWGTLAQVILRPTRFFEHMAAHQEKAPSSNKAFIFGVWVLFLGQSISAFWLISLAGQSLDTIFQGSKENALLGALLGNGESQPNPEDLSYLIHLATVQAHLEFILAPLIAFFAIHLIAGSCHFLGRSMQGPEAESPPYDLTLRWVAYAQAPFIFATIPTLGLLLATGWTGVLLIRGLVRFHQISFARAMVTVLSTGMLLKILWSSALHRVSLYILLTFFPHLS
tara:strand:+ start:146 stop:928 length:783 start_codon:yes stop_codon:yes gene_type:complete